jgi:hypothetical protein
MTESSSHPTLTVVLSVADIAIKLAAVIIGGWWTLWNYRKSRTYKQKLELEVSSTVFIKEDLYGDVRLVVKNIGETRHPVQHEGTFCELFLVRNDLSEVSTGLTPVFSMNQNIEPGEVMDDTYCWRISRPLDGILWVRITLRIVSDGVEWTSTRLVRVEAEPASTEEVI